MSIKESLKKAFGADIVKVTIKNQWLFVDIKRPMNPEYENKHIKQVEDFCRNRWDYPNNISVGWGY